ncbi:ligand-gated channel protein [Shewanella xiamenensis]|uniref:TonB-dependent receptor n=1 Tax=Shewanella xiamenensis TaxID=332186 RepID=UPI0011852D89|nr:TonB-dependent receptor [Shewanella xiamenensis]TVL15208.1 ligand-gated channel protein [Shewanella xiamenensis]TVL15275.1 ligand-gated channel protein [Shewanella xiamenensis]TVL22914.1 ligand-gated channel protein [Shewanella xiamenensis]TVL29324.1 ligand-gated channel protein [Shewanella xiamenensis]TVO98254.1 ligand-gated channel protein [Shewanella xiamenensis]
MHHLTLAARAVRASLITMGSASVLLSGITIAAEENTKVERIEVTGSRIKQVDMETVSPVTVINAADIAMTGEKTVADVLNNSAINSFGSWRGVSGYGSGASSTSNVNLRGLGSSATLVLLDGRRMPGTSSSSGSVADTSSIPMAIVERIEILRDGASAVYGSDAVAGVINIITKKEFDGLQLDYSTEQPSVEGGDANRLSIATGYNTDKGNITLTYEYYDTKAVMDRDIWNMDDPSYATFSGFSSVPNGKYGTGNGSWYSNSDICDQTENTVDTTDGNNKGRCLYDSGRVTKLFGDQTRNSFLSNFTYEITDGIQFRGRASASLAETETRYAGTPVSTNYPVMSADNKFNPVGEDMTLYMRSAQIGERDTLTETNNVDILGGFIGTLDLGNGIDWELNAQHSRSTTNSFNYNLINDEIVQQGIDSEQYDIFNTTGMSYEQWNQQMTELYSKAAHTGVYQGKFESTQIDGLASTLLVDNGDVSVAMVGGLEYEMIKFKQTSDPESASGIISGGSGGDDVDATRDRSAAYLEFQVGLPANVELSAAVRYERYEQEGSLTGAQGQVVNSSTFDAVVPKFGISWRPVDSLLLRASYGDSFRAPNMGEMFSSQSLSFEKAVDSLWCNEPGNVDAVYCATSNQHKTWYGGNPDLEAEEGNSLTLGGVWNATDNWNIELSYFSIAYENKIESISVNDILRDEIKNGSSPYVHRGSDGKIEYIEAGVRNLATVETSGIDFVTAYNLETGIGDFNFRLDLTHVLDFKKQDNAESEMIDYAGFTDSPDWRGNFATSWKYDDFSAAWTVVYIGRQSADYYNQLEETDVYVDYSNYFKHNIQFAYNHAYNGSITVGVNNVFDADAPNFYTYADYRDVNVGLYDVLGRTYYLRINQKF